MTKRVRVVAGFLLCVAIAAVGWFVFVAPSSTISATGGKHGGATASKGAVPVVAAPVQKGDIRVVLTGLGTVVPLATVTVKTQINGRLVEIDFKEGQMVKEGDPLAVIDPRPYELSLQQAEGQLTRDQALLADAQINLKRYQKLVAENSIAKQQLDTQKSLVQQYEGAVQTDMAQIGNAKLNLTYCHIVAPVSGRVGLRQVDLGNVVQTGDANGLVVITQMQPITVNFTLPEDNLALFHKKFNDGMTFDVLAFDRKQTTQLASGKLLAIDNQMDTSTGTIKLRAQFANEDESLYPNQFVNAQLVVDTLRDVTLVPSAAIQRGSQGTYVYLVNADNTVSVRNVKLGTVDGDRQMVEGGLAPGDAVVVDGADKLRDGAAITLPSAQNQGGDKAGDRPGEKTGKRKDK